MHISEPALEPIVPPAALPSTILTFNSLLEASGIDLANVLVFRHRPQEAALNRALSWIAEERHDLFRCYQSTHNVRTEQALMRASYVASFIRGKGSTAVFVGLYNVAGSRPLGRDECLARPEHVELVTLGMSGQFATDGRDTVLEFDLTETGWQPTWRGRLIVKWPPPDRSWYRWADRNVFEVSAIAQNSLLRAVVPAWDAMTLDWSELALLPDAWKAALSQWRGIYLIIDRSDGRQYVGSAYGAANMMQRWLDYARTGHGGNRQLRSRDAANFRFSILQRVSPDLDADAVVAIETSWKHRLRTLIPYGLNEN